MAADKRLAKHLDLKVGDDVLFIRTLSVQDEIPIVIANSYFPAQRVPGLLEAFSGVNSISKALKRVGVASYSQAWVRINARMAYGGGSPSARDVHRNASLHQGKSRSL